MWSLSWSYTKRCVSWGSNVHLPYKDIHLLVWLKVYTKGLLCWVTNPLIFFLRTCWFLHASMRLWLLIWVCAHATEVAANGWRMFFHLCMCCKNCKYELYDKLKPLLWVLYSCYAVSLEVSRYHKSDTVSNFGQEVLWEKHVSFFLHAEDGLKMWMPHSARSCSLANYTPNYLWDVVLI